ncbi:DUF2087 domain-containing protein [Streptomyces armeniacus]|uniref:DUF2087 domain-containing protein n=1 Tax=Streptomyces armeniacus TaxID=83291 RepID=A0A345XNC0_9ACTN|nr:DUF2087 domain-containing protein [Streptomyces armeniacus]AXK33136.1 DUF2087 domain-containing protein [Streptomyces armeniacus]
MSDNASGSSHGVSALFSHGRLTAIPRRVARREQLLAHLAETLFEPRREYSEQQVNEALLTVHEDCSALRRYLVTGGFMTRTRDGSSYRRADAALSGSEPPGPA